MAEIGEKWLSVAELARTLEQPERTVRRWAQNVAETDRKRLPNGRTVYNLAAFRDLKPGEVPYPSESGENLPIVTENIPNNIQDRAELIEALRAEVEFLRGELQQAHRSESELRILLLAEKQRALRQKAVRRLPAPSEPQTGEIPQTSADAAQGQAGRPWWQFWKGRANQ